MKKENKMGIIIVYAIWYTFIPSPNKNKMSFVKDLAKWKEVEKAFAKYLIDYPDVISIEFPKGKCKDYDVKMTYGNDKVATYEIKTDFKAQNTGNFVIEYRFKWEASWIYASKADYIVQYILGKWWIQSRGELILRINQIEKRETKWWDWFQSSLYIIKADKLSELFEPLNFNETPNESET